MTKPWSELDKWDAPYRNPFRETWGKVELALTGALAALIVAGTGHALSTNSNKKEFDSNIELARQVTGILRTNEHQASTTLNYLQEYRSKVANDITNSDPNGGRLYSPINESDLARFDKFLAPASNAVYQAEKANRDHIMDTERYIKQQQKNK